MGVFSVSCSVCVCVCVCVSVCECVCVSVCVCVCLGSVSESRADFEQSYAAVFFLAEFWFGETQRVIFLYVQRHK